MLSYDLFKEKFTPTIASVWWRQALCHPSTLLELSLDDVMELFLAEESLAANWILKAGEESWPTGLVSVLVESVFVHASAFVAPQPGSYINPSFFRLVKWWEILTIVILRDQTSSHVPPPRSASLEAQGVKERKLAGWGLSRGKAWKGSLNVTEKNAPQMEANTAIMEDAPAMKLFSSCCTWSRSRQPKWNGSCKNLKIVHFTWVSQPCNAKNTVNTTVFDSMDGGGVEPTTSGLQAARGGG